VNEYKQRVIDFFNQRTNYDNEGTRHPREAKRLLASIQLQPGQKILDLATGTGLLAIPAAQQVGKTGTVIGVDFSPEMLQQARQKVLALGIDNLELIEADVESIKFNPNSFDGIFCCSAITYLVDIPTALQHWYRWLKPKGYLAFTTPSQTAYLASIQVEVCEKILGISLPHINEPLWTPEKCHNLLQQAGFSEIEVEIEESGEYLSFNNRWVNWSGNGFYPRGNPLVNLSFDQLEQLKAEYQREIEKLVTDRGIWYERTTFFVQAGK
jgi:ubiquinone/menaquinone biosynthesis C-methylase UbiE